MPLTPLTSYCTYRRRSWNILEILGLLIYRLGFTDLILQEASAANTLLIGQR